MTTLSDIYQFFPRYFKKFTPLPGVLLCLSIPLLCLWWGVGVLSFSCVLWARVSLSLLLWWNRRSRVSLVLLSKFLLDFDSILIVGSKLRDIEEVHLNSDVPM